MSFDQRKEAPPAAPKVLKSADVSFLDYVKRDRDLSGQIDISVVRSVFAVRKSELILRMLILGIGALGLFVLMDDIVPPALFLIHFIGVFLVRLFIRRQPKIVGYAVFAVIVLGDFINVAVFGAMIVYLGTSGDISYSILAFFLFAGFYMHTVGDRIAMKALLTNDVLVQATVMTLQIVWIWGEYKSGANPSVFTFANTMLIIGGGVALHLYFLLLCRDVQSARLQLQEAQRRRIADERLLAIGQLSGGIAHDFNNMLTAVLGNLELMRMTGESKERDDLLKEAEAAARSGAELTAQLLAYARRAHMSPRPMSVLDALQSCEPRLRDELRGNQTLMMNTETADTLPKVFLDSPQFCSVLSGVVENAVDAMDDEGQVVVTTHRAKVPEGGVTVEVRDTGHGISPEILPLVFEPYFTTKPKGHGTGLGLAMARGIVEQIGGRMDMTSEPGRSTTVRIHLPPANVQSAR